MGEDRASGAVSAGAPSEDVGSSRLNEGITTVDFRLFHSLEDLENLTPTKMVEAVEEDEAFE